MSDNSQRMLNDERTNGLPLSENKGRQFDSASGHNILLNLIRRIVNLLKRYKTFNKYKYKKIL